MLSLEFQTLGYKMQRFLVVHTSDLVSGSTFSSPVTVPADEEPFWEHAVGGGVSDEEDEGEPARAQERQPPHHGGLPVRAGEACVLAGCARLPHSCIFTYVLKPIWLTACAATFVNGVVPMATTSARLALWCIFFLLWCVFSTSEFLLKSPLPFLLRPPQARSCLPGWNTTARTTESPKGSPWSCLTPNPEGKRWADLDKCLCGSPSGFVGGARLVSVQPERECVLNVLSSCSDRDALYHCFCWWFLWTEFPGAAKRLKVKGLLTFSFPSCWLQIT